MVDTNEKYRTSLENGIFSKSENTLQGQLDKYARKEQLAKLLSGNFSSDAQMQHDLEKVGVYLSSEDYMVWFIHAEYAEGLKPSHSGNNTFMTATKMVEQAALHLVSQRYSCIVEHVEHGTACILGMDHISPGGTQHQPDFNGELTKMGSQLIKWSKEHAKLELSIYMGRPGSGLSAIVDSYADVINMMNYCQFMDSSPSVVQYLDFEQMKLTDSSGKQSVRMLKTYLGHIDRQDYPSAKDSLLAYAEYELVTNASVPEYARLKLSTIAYLLLVALESTPADTSAIQPKDILNSITRSSKKNKAMVQLRTDIETIFEQIEAAVRQDSEKKWPQWLRPLLDYVDINCCDPSINVAHISNRFGLTPAYVTKVMRQTLDIGLLEYIQRRRLEKATALIGSGMTLTEIAKESGFSSLRTMRRTFLRYEGATPSSICFMLEE